MYQPSEIILKKYADVLLNFALNSGEGIKKEEVVFIRVPECAKPILPHLVTATLEAGANPIIDFMPDDLSRLFFEKANNSQLEFFPEKYLKGKVDQADHLLFILAENNLHELEGIDPKKIMMRTKSMKPYIDWRNKKEAEGKQTWTLALYGTAAMAKEAKLSQDEYWSQIISACFLREKDPVKRWKEVTKEISRIKNKLTQMEIQKINIKSKNTDLNLTIGKNRKWLGGSGRNIPSFEVFTSPDCRKTEGYIFLNQPLYIAGNLVQDIYLEFKNGSVVKSSAKKGEKFLKEMLSAPNADKLGEFSLTDSRHSKITKFMASTLYDENVGGKFGNSHIAVGRSFSDAFNGEVNKLTPKKLLDMGFNDSVVHTDIITTENRTVTATLNDNSQKVIYTDGNFTI